MAARASKAIISHNFSYNLEIKVRFDHIVQVFDFNALIRVSARQGAIASTSPMLFDQKFVEEGHQQLCVATYFIKVVQYNKHRSTVPYSILV